MRCAGTSNPPRHVASMRQNASTRPTTPTFPHPFRCESATTSPPTASIRQAAAISAVSASAAPSARSTVDVPAARNIALGSADSGANAVRSFEQYRVASSNHHERRLGRVDIHADGIHIAGDEAPLLSSVVGVDKALGDHCRITGGRQRRLRAGANRVGTSHGHQRGLQPGH